MMDKSNKAFTQIKNIFLRAISFARTINISDVGIIALLIALAILIRIPLLSFFSRDYFGKIRVWILAIREGGFWGFKNNFSNYNPPYLYLLYMIVRFFPDTPDVLVAKIPSLITDFLCAYLVYLLVKIKYPKNFYPILAACTFLFLPTVILNSAFWGQEDVLYTMPLLACLFFLIKKKNTLAFLAFGVSLAFKLQAVFLAPLLLALFFRKEVSWKHFLLIPLVLFLAIVPSWIAGRPLMDLLSIYFSQANYYPQLTDLAASAYNWIPDNDITQNFFTPAGLIFTSMLSFSFAILVYKSRAKLTPDLMIKLGLVCLLFVPFFLPKMHDRYFYPADTLSIVFGFFYPEYFFIPIIIELVSFFSYQPSLFEVALVPFVLLSGGIFVTLVILVKDTVRHLYIDNENREDKIETAQ